MIKKTGDPAGVFDYDSCIECGECLAGCPYGIYTRRAAAREIRRMKAGKHSIAADLCFGCMTCDTRCPHGCRPYSLIRSLWHSRYQRRGLPAKARFMVPHEQPNFRSAVKLPPAARKLRDSFARPPGADTILYTGCNTLMLPEMLETRLLDGLAPFGGFQYCCGEMYYRMGVYDTARQAALRLRDAFRDTGARQVVFICAAGMNMVSNVYPNEFGVDFDFEKKFLPAWLLERLDEGAWGIEREIDARVTVQDPCHAKMLGGWVYDSTRRLLKAIGARVVEMRHTREESLCCGVAAGCANYRMADIVATGGWRLAESALTGADYLAAPCNGCLLTLALIGLAAPGGPKPVSPLQLASMAAGENPGLDLARRRAALMLPGFLRHAFPFLLSTRRFRVQPL